MKTGEIKENRVQQEKDTFHDFHRSTKGHSKVNKIPVKQKQTKKEKKRRLNNFSKVLKRRV